MTEPNPERRDTCRAGRGRFGPPYSAGLRLLAAHVPAPAAGRCLDVGCGTGELARHPAASGHPVDAVDRSAVALAEAGRAAGDGVAYRQPDVGHDSLARHAGDHKDIRTAIGFPNRLDEKQLGPGLTTRPTRRRSIRSASCSGRRRTVAPPACFRACPPTAPATRPCSKAWPAFLPCGAARWCGAPGLRLGSRLRAAPGRGQPTDRRIHGLLLDRQRHRRHRRDLPLHAGRLGRRLRTGFRVQLPRARAVGLCPAQHPGRTASDR